ncbi:MAG: Levanase precursor [Lentisphaerae bacterium ADurb.BinA184]|nr:MAG: Levanase precursor [Lentisphaerae bacterium ADurb.BinA184]
MNDPAADLSSWIAPQPAPPELAGLVRRFREKLMADPYRPGYHFAIPEGEGYPGDPNAAFYAAGRYHLMYLYRRAGEGFAWGHVSSADLLHWRHHPDALRPGQGDEGIFSGGVHVAADGRATAAYWALGKGRGIGLAFADGPDYDMWTKSPHNPAIPSTEDGITTVPAPDGRPTTVGCVDPSNLWRENGRWYVALGNLCLLNKVGRGDNARPEDQGDRLYLFASDDLRTWEYRGLLYEGDRRWTDASEDCMCPSLFPLPRAAAGGPPSGQHLLLFIAHNKGCQYYIGEYAAERFTPRVHGRMSRIDNAFFAPEAMMDAKGRQIMWAWIFDGRPQDRQRASGWTGVYGLPRSLWLGADGALRLAPVEELARLRLPPGTPFARQEIAAGRPVALDAPARDLVEIELVLRPGNAARCGLHVMVSANERTTVFWDRDAAALGIDTTPSSTDSGVKAVETLPLALAAGEDLALRVFLDRGIVEVFANDRQAVARAVYPVEQGHGVCLFAEGGGAELLRGTAWELAPSNPF